MVSIPSSMDHHQLGNLVWKVTALFPSGIFLPDEFPCLGLTGSEGSGETAARTPWGLSCRVLWSPWRPAQPGCLLTTQLSPGVNRAGLAAVFAESQVRGGLLGEIAANCKLGMKRQLSRGCERVKLLLMTKCGLWDGALDTSPNLSWAFTAH